MTRSLVVKKAYSHENVTGIVEFHSQTNAAMPNVYEVRTTIRRGGNVLSRQCEHFAAGGQALRYFAAERSTIDEHLRKTAETI